ncbi:cytochrome P450 [Coniophora puteana RWD-64-598 SS2]|uniref:Cytochrome P450 n=1 Tax=Coniophora puteana (strain RWD-64-598) TaxID=741705 RepID=R7SCX6_CONPW|nr:cytochrome P450 [Coniophora puteana RWD-64-598 SS2]EIW74018.1 cytochrome P450 [Coniophora puteana RWD-64-598 SS2]
MSPINYYNTFSYFVAAVGFAITISVFRKRRDHKLPPGPSGLPFIGNVHQLDTAKDRKGDIMYCRILGQDVIVLISEKVAQDLLNQWSSNYSDRIEMPALTDPYGLTYNTALLGHSDSWRFHRRIFHQTLRSNVAVAYRPMQLVKTAELVENIAKSPEAWWDHTRRFSAGVILSAMYDHELSGTTEDDGVLKTVATALQLLTRLFTPETAMLITMFPIVKSIPTWLPGGWLNVVHCKNVIGEMYHGPFNMLEARLDAGEANQCVASDALTRFRNTDKIDNLDDVVRGVCGTAYAAGEETTGATVIIFMLAMTLYPEVQARAQAEIDEVVGTDRLPDFEDRTSLPYLEAVYCETLRWRPVAPTGIQHATTDADVYNGYYIPKGALVISNIWAMSQNPDKYPSPSSFDPSRFLDADGSLVGNEPEYAFGFGRRICPGRHLANGSVWSAMARILSVFQIEKAKDAAGNVIYPDPEWTLGLTTFPKPFPCKITQRRVDVPK